MNDPAVLSMVQHHFVHPHQNVPSATSSRRGRKLSFSERPPTVLPPIAQADLEEEAPVTTSKPSVESKGTQSSPTSSANEAEGHVATEREAMTTASDAELKSSDCDVSNESDAGDSTSEHDAQIIHREGKMESTTKDDQEPSSVSRKTPRQLTGLSQSMRGRFRGRVLFGNSHADLQVPQGNAMDAVVTKIDDDAYEQMKIQARVDKAEAAKSQAKASTKEEMLEIPCNSCQVKRLPDVLTRCLPCRVSLPSFPLDLEMLKHDPGYSRSTSCALNA